VAAAAAAVVAVEAVVVAGTAAGRLQEGGWWAEVEQLRWAVRLRCLRRPSRAPPAGGQSCCPCG